MKQSRSAFGVIPRAASAWPAPTTTRGESTTSTNAYRPSDLRRVIVPDTSAVYEATSISPLAA